MRRWKNGLALASAATLCVVSVASAGNARTVIEFDPAAGEFPEGVAAARHGEVYTGLSGTGRIIEVGTDGGAHDMVGLSLSEGDFGPGGMGISAMGTLASTVISADPELRGVIFIDRVADDDGMPDDVWHLEGSEGMTMPNAVAFAPDENVLYITDSAEGTIWRAEWQGFVGWLPAELWMADPLLEGTGELPFPFPVGANGVAIRDGVVYVGVTEQSHIVGVPVLPDGSAGEPFVHLDLPGVSIDGIAITADGDFVIADPPANTIWLVGGDGVPVTAADASDGISGPTSVYLDASLDDQPVYVANMAQAVVGELAQHPPSIMAIDMD